MSTFSIELPAPSTSTRPTIPSTTSSQPPGPTSIQAASTPQPAESVPFAPPPVVVPRNRDQFADPLPVEHRRSFQHLRGDDYRALGEGEVVVLHRGGEWGRNARVEAESRTETESAAPLEFDGYDPASEGPQARNKYIQFLLSFAGALRTRRPSRPPRWVKTALRTLRGQAQGSGPRYPSDLRDTIGRVEAELDRTFVSSSSSSEPSSIGSALTSPPPSRRPAWIIAEGSNVMPWPSIASLESSPPSPGSSPPSPSPESSRVGFLRSKSCQTARSRAASIATTSSFRSGYSSIIPPSPRPRARTVEPHWFAIYMAQRWPVPDTYVSRRTYSSPSALCPPMPYHWRPICHISPERPWEITNLAIRVEMPPPPQPLPAPSTNQGHVRQHFPTPVTSHGCATPSSSTSSSRCSSRSSASPAIYPEASQVTSHRNPPINASQHTLPLVIPNLYHDVVTSKMVVSEALRHLARHGCPDVTETLVPLPYGVLAPPPLAGGRFGDVYRWADTSGHPISIKCLRIHALSDTSSKNVKRATRELYYWSKARHKNVLELRGVARFNGQLAMVSPWMENGNLSQYLRELSPETDRWDLCLQIGEGLAYLHEIGMVHGDLKALNILVSNEGVIKISDFGDSILENPSLGFTLTGTVGGGSLRWLAFELFDDTNMVKRSTMTDVYALGMTILEVVTGRVPYYECHGDTQVICTLMKKKLPVRPVELSENMKRGNERWELMVKCWDTEPSQRPTSRAVLNMMKELYLKN